MAPVAHVPLDESPDDYSILSGKISVGRLVQGAAAIGFFNSPDFPAKPRLSFRLKVISYLCPLAFALCEHEKGRAPLGEGSSFICHATWMSLSRTSGRKSAYDITIAISCNPSGFNKKAVGRCPGDQRSFKSAAKPALGLAFNILAQFPPSGLLGSYH